MRRLIFLAPMASLVGPLVVLVSIAVPASAEQVPNIDRGILGDWEAKPFTWRTGDVKGCRYRQIITIDRKVSPGRYVGTYKARTSCVSKAWNLRGKIFVSVTGRAVTIDADTKYWIRESVRYVNSYRMEGKDAKGHPMIYVRPKGAPNS